MRKLYLMLMTIALIGTSASAAPKTGQHTATGGGGGVTFEKLFSKRSTDAFRYVEEVSSGGYILAGYTSDSTSSDTAAFAVRMDAFGDTLWTYTLDGSGKDLFYKVINTSDGGFAFCGYSTSFNGSEDILITKLDNNGQQQWIQRWGGSQKERGQDIIETSNGDFAICGYTNSAPALYYDAVFFRVSSNGDSLVTRRYGNSGFDDANAIRQLADGGFILGGQSGGPNFDCYLVRTNPNGTAIWQQRFGTLGNDNIESIVILADGFLCGGGSNLVQQGDDNAYITKTDTAGNALWAKSYGGNQPDDFHRVEPTSDGGFIASGTTSSQGSSRPNMWMVKLDANADTMWTRTFGGDNHDHGYSAIETSDGGYIFAGYTSSFGFRGEDAFVVKTDMMGNVFDLLTYTTVAQVVNPTSATCGGGPALLRVLIRNFGNEIVPNVPATADITGSTTTTLNDIYNGNFFPLDADTLQFNTPFTTVPGGTYTFTVFTNNNNDVYPAMNTLVTTVTIDGNFGAPVTVDGDRCGDGSVSLTATAQGNIYWFTTATGGLPVDSGTTFNTPSISTNTTYYAQTGLNCPSTRVPAQATINALPSVNLGNDTSVTSGTLLTLDAGNGFSSYAWTPGGENTQTISVTTGATYCVTVTDANSCTNTDCITLAFNVGVDENSNGVYSLYPNPAKDHFILTFNNNQKAAEVQVTNCLGMIVKNEIIGKADAMSGYNVNVGNLPSGVYIVRVKTDGKIYSQRVVLN